jgi:DNA-binding phage protein
MAKRIIQKLTAEQAANYRRKVKEVESHKDEIIEQGKEMLARHRRRVAELGNIFQHLRSEREKRGLSLADMQRMTGMSREVICRLENQTDGNPTINSIQRYAEALGLKAMLQFVSVE